MAVRKKKSVRQRPVVSIDGILFEPDPLWVRLSKYPKWIRDYIHEVNTFVGAQEVQEIFFLRDQNRALIKLVAELKAENRRLRKRLERA